MRPSKWGNQWSHKNGTLAKFKVGSRKEAVNAFREHLEIDEQLQKDVEELRDKTIACICKENELCHGDIIIEFLHRDRLIETLLK